MNRSRPLFLALSLLGGAPAAMALSLGVGPATAAMGQPLDVAVPLQVDAGEQGEASCVQAVVRYGDARLAASAVKAWVEAGRPGGGVRVRVRTAQAVDEPVVRLTLHVGCHAHTLVSRRYTLLASPSAPSPVPAATLASPPVAPASSPAPAPRASPVQPSPSQGQPGAPAGLADDTAPSAVSPPVDEVASAHDRLAALEALLQRLHEDNVQLRRELQALAGRETPGHGPPWLPFALLAGVGLAGWAAWGWQRRRAGKGTWSPVPPQAEPGEGQAPPAAAREQPLLAVVPGAAGMQASLSEAVPPPVAPAPPAPEVLPAAPFDATRTSVLPPPVVSPPPPGAETVEALLDLEQQAEFYGVLGQDEAAIRLLESHLQAHPGGTPLAGFKLLDIHRRRGDRAAYELVRARLRSRHGTRAPAWEDWGKAGRSLEDHPAVVRRLQALWHTPRWVMEEVERLLLHGADGTAAFDLPACRDLLMLYAVARELAEPAVGRDVDVLLPLELPSQRTAGSLNGAGGEAQEVDLPLDIELPAPAPQAQQWPAAAGQVTGRLAEEVADQDLPPARVVPGLG